MRGTVIGFDDDTNTGAVSGEDGKRYDFVTLDWRGQGTAKRGDIVDFTSDGERATQIAFLAAEYVKPDIGQFYFSPWGRISRSQYWLHYVLPFFAIAALLRLAALAHGETRQDPGLLMGLLNLFYIAALWPSIAVLVKRIHDRDKSGWLILLFYIPFFIGIGLAAVALAYIASGNIHTGNQFATFGAVWFAGVGIIGIWFFIDFGCMPGTVGANAYGPDPLEHPLTPPRPQSLTPPGSAPRP
jgi:uncharacterized membrane protein YhaH (DUF805 family)